MKKILLLFCFFTFSLFGEVNDSIIPLMDQMCIKDLIGKVNDQQRRAIEDIFKSNDETLRIMSFNMLFNYPAIESRLDPENRWELRKSRLIEYLRWADADIIGSQELLKGQIDEVMSVIGNTYCYYGNIESEEEKEEKEITAIFYRKNRLKLLEGKTYYYSNIPCEVSQNHYSRKNSVTFCRFQDLRNGKQLAICNTHLTFRCAEERYYEGCSLRQLINILNNSIPLFVVGDFNTFPFRQQLDLPFFDGDGIESLIKGNSLEDSRYRAIFGHFGPIATTNYCSEKQKTFCGEGQPGVILDHIFVNSRVKVVTHGIDPARVNGLFPSDHFPVIVDVLLN
ncbi:MAG: endonuclease/exonuclease/phosphatase family protein [Chlamydiales bacterium]